MSNQDQNVDLLVASLATHWGFVSQGNVQEIVDRLKNENAKRRDGSLAKELVSSSLLSPQRAQLLESLVQEIVAECGSLESGIKILGLEEQMDSRSGTVGGTLKPHENDSIVDRDSTLKFLLPAPENSIETSETFGKTDIDTPSPQGSGAKLSKESFKATNRFEIQRFLAQGGIGQVSVALDKELNREVAYKEIRNDRNVDRDSCDRFLIEAEVTGRLEHPGVVPIYSLGSGNDGLPFYAMRFIRGQSLTEAIKAHYASAGNEAEADVSAAGDLKDSESNRQIRFRQLLQNFVSVCNTLHFAHDRGVVHRDIKPDNIMLGSFGETLVVDWGIAKTGVTKNSNPIETDNQLAQFDESLIPEISAKQTTQQGDVLGTPGYMSPEQIVGWQDRIDAGSDVYSLGATFYALITGKNPYKENSFAALSKKVLAGDVVKPHKINPQVPKALEAIALKAMSPKPSARYDSAKSLALDVEAWLADEPTLAYSDPLWPRIKRWLRRHPAVASGTSAAIALTLVGLTIGIAVVGQFNKKLETVNLNLSDSNRREVAQRIKIEKANTDLLAANQREIAQRQRAEENLKVAQSAVEKYLFQVSVDPTLQSPAFGKIRSALLTTAIPFYEKFLLQDPGDEKVETSRGEAMLRLGYIWLQTGEIEECIDQYRSAITLFEKLIEQSPGNEEHPFRLANAFDELAIAENKLGKIEPSIEHIQRSIAIYEKLLNDDDVDQELVNRKLAISFGNLSAFHFLSGDVDSTEKYVLKSNEHIQTIEKSPEIRFLQTSNLNSLGVVANRRQDYRQGWEHINDAFLIASELVKEYPGATTYRRHLGSCLYNVTKSFIGMNNIRDAKANFEAALVHRRWLAGNYPSVPDFRSELAVTLNDYGNASMDIFQDVETSRKMFAESIKLSEELTNEFPEIPKYRERLAQTIHNLGRLYQDQGQFAESSQMDLKSLQNFQKLHAEFPKNPIYHSHLAVAQLSMGINYQHSLEYKKSIEWFDLAIETFGNVKNYRSHENQDAKMRAYWGRAECLDGLEQFSNASQDWKLAVDQANTLEMKHILRMRMAMSSANAGDVETLNQCVAKLVQFDRRNSESYFRIAKAFAICADKLGSESMHFEDLSQRCIESLTEAKSRGYFASTAKIEAFEKDAKFQVFQSLEEFASFVSDLK